MKGVKKNKKYRNLHLGKNQTNVILTTEKAFYLAFPSLRKKKKIIYQPIFIQSYIPKLLIYHKVIY